MTAVRRVSYCENIKTELIYFDVNSSTLSMVGWVELSGYLVHTTLFTAIEYRPLLLAYRGLKIDLDPHQNLGFGLVFPKNMVSVSVSKPTQHYFTRPAQC